MNPMNAGCSARVSSSWKTDLNVVGPTFLSGGASPVAGNTPLRHVVTAINERTGERFIVRGNDLYETVAEVAEQVSIEQDGG